MEGPLKKARPVNVAADPTGRAAGLVRKFLHPGSGEFSSASGGRGAGPPGARAASAGPELAGGGKVEIASPATRNNVKTKVLRIRRGCFRVAPGSRGGANPRFGVERDVLPRGKR